MSEVEKLTKIPSIIKERITKSLLELKLSVKTLEATISVLTGELDSICKKCEHFKIPDYRSDDGYAQPECIFYGECDVKEYRGKLKEES